MFSLLTEKFQKIVSQIGKGKTLNETAISEAVREVRLALLEADVNYGVAKAFIARVKEKAVGQALIKSVEAGQQFIKIVHDELITLMGGGEAPLILESFPAVVMLCGLQGSGKTTHCAKLARYLQKKESKRRVLLVACDLQRPAAIEQLQTLAAQVGAPVFALPGEKDPLKVARLALEKAKSEKFDTVIVDTAGRLHVDEELMVQLQELKNLLQPQETLFVANAMTGQDAVKSATEMHARVSLTGTILTMLDGDTRGGAAISIREVTGCPLKFEGVGEKIDDLQLFNPRSMADRILGMGDVVNLVNLAQEHISQEEAQRLEQKLRKAAFNFEDFRSQMQMIKKMGSIKKLAKMVPIPGLNSEALEKGEKEFKKVEAIIGSMTPRERQGIDEITISRRKRLARGSGTKLEDVNKLIKNHEQMNKFMKQTPNRKKIQKMMGGTPC